jgi:hypothetical protein
VYSTVYWCRKHFIVTAEIPTDQSAEAAEESSAMEAIVREEGEDRRLALKRNSTNGPTWWGIKEGTLSK